jgi:hypothetical protein
MERDEMSVWIPIETAPKDGSKILLAKIVGHPAHPTALWWAVAGSWSARFNNWNDGIEPAGLAQPNYWSPLPLMPVQSPANAIAAGGGE